MATSSGMRSSSMIWRMKSKSGCEAAGNPTSISLKPMPTRVSKNWSFRAGSIGSIRAWLPSRRSTLHHSGATSRWRSAQVRSGSWMGRFGRYFSNGMSHGVG